MPFTPEGRGNVRTVREVKEGAQASLDVRLAGFAPVTVHPVGTRGTAREVVMEGEHTLDQEPNPVRFTVHAHERTEVGRVEP